MFDSVIIDMQPYATGDPTCDISERRLYPFFYLIADTIYERGRGQGSSKTPTFVRRVFLENEGRPHSFDYVKDDIAILFSPSRQLRAKAIQDAGITVRSASLLLAAAGLEISIPNFTLDTARSDEVASIREKLEEERKEFQIAMMKLADESYQRLIAKVYGDTAEWAISEALFKIKPKAIALELAMRKLDRRLLERISLSFFSEGIPVIGSAFVDGGTAKAAAVTMEKMLEVLCVNLSRSIVERKTPEVVYGYKVNRLLGAAPF